MLQLGRGNRYFFILLGGMGEEPVSHPRFRCRRKSENPCQVSLKTGLEKQFNDLIEALRKNQVALQQSKVSMHVGGIDPIGAIRASQAAMERIALNNEWSANVGIGYAYSAEYVAQSNAF